MKIRRTLLINTQGRLEYGKAYIKAVPLRYCSLAKADGGNAEVLFLDIRRALLCSLAFLLDFLVG